MPPHPPLPHPTPIELLSVLRNLGYSFFLCWYFEFLSGLLQGVGGIQKHFYDVKGVGQKNLGVGKVIEGHHKNHCFLLNNKLVTHVASVCYFSLNNSSSPSHDESFHSADT